MIDENFKVESAREFIENKSPQELDFPTIARMSENRRWKRWGYSSWDDLMRVVFDKKKKH